MRPLPLPICARCNRTVDGMTIEPTDRPHVRKVTARCHGEVDVCEIDLIEFNPAIAEIVEAVAFKPKEGEVEWKK